MDIGLLRLNNTTGEITFEIGNNPPLVKGINKLVQLVLITMLTSPRSDKFDNYGGGLVDLLSKPMNPNNPSQIKGDISVIVGSTQNQLISEQTDPNIPSEERLKQIDLVNVTINRDALEVEMLIRIVSEDDEIAFVRL